MKKISLLIGGVSLLFSCSLKQEEILNEENSFWNVIYENKNNEKNILSDEEFLNSEENKENKRKALECMEKIKGKDLDYNWLFQAFEYDWNCYYFLYNWNFNVISHLYTTSEKRKDYLGLNYLVSKVNNYDNDYFKECIHDRVFIEINILDNFDDIFKENNIFPPRIIYSNEEVFNSEYFLFLNKDANFEYNEKDLTNYKNLLNNFYKYKKSDYYFEISNTFEKVKNIILEKYIKWLIDISEGEPKCYFFYDYDWNYDSDLEKIWFNDDEKFYIYDLEDLLKRKEELEKI